jgi:hypothetical protein
LLLLNSKPKPMWQTIWRPQPLSFYVIAFSFLIDQTSNVWWIGCLFNAHLSQFKLVSWLWFVWKVEHQQDYSWTPSPSQYPCWWCGAEGLKGTN